MSNKVFQQNLDDKKGSQPGGPYLIQMLFKEPVEMPDKEKMTAIMEKHIGSTECFCYDKKMAGFAALNHVAEFQDGKCPVQLMVMKCDKFKGKGFDAFLMSQMWDCQEDREWIFRECKYQVVATDMLTAALSALERANLDADFLEALAELYPTCEAFYFQNCGKLFLAEDVRSHQIEGPDRFIRFGVNVRFFNIEGTEDMLIDTVGMSTLFLPDLQYHFHGMDPNWVVNHAYNATSYMSHNGCAVHPYQLLVFRREHPVPITDTMPVSRGNPPLVLLWVPSFSPSPQQFVQDIVQMRERITCAYGLVVISPTSNLFIQLHNQNILLPRFSSAENRVRDIGNDSLDRLLGRLDNQLFVILSEVPAEEVETIVNVGDNGLFIRKFQSAFSEKLSNQFLCFKSQFRCCRCDHKIVCIADEVYFVGILKS